MHTNGDFSSQRDKIRGDYITLRLQSSCMASREQKRGTTAPFFFSQWQLLANPWC